MNQQVEFWPLDKAFKDPARPVRVNEEARFFIRFSRPINPEYVYLCLTKDGEQEVRYPMHELTRGRDEKKEFEVKLTVTTKGLYFYHFLVETTAEDVRIGCGDSMEPMLGRGGDWQLTVYDDTYKVPSWLKGGLIYQIFPDRFNIGGERLKTKSDIVYRDDWGGVPEYKPTSDGKILNNDMFGGNLLGITKKLGYLKSLGVTAIYMNPIFEAHSNHKYDTGSYMRVDPDFGTEDDLKTLIKRADKKGIKILLDGVFSHTGDDSIYFNKYSRYDSVGAYESKESPYSDWYRFTDFASKKYDCWWDIEILPNTNELSKGFLEFISGEDGVIRKWTRLGIGGWRLDVVDELPDAFLDKIYRAAKAVNSEALILGEVWEDASNKTAYSIRRRYLQGGQLDSVMNYPFKEDIFHFVLTGDNKKLYNTVNILKNNYLPDVLNSVMNMLGTHDTVRVLSALGTSGDVSTKDKRATAMLTDRGAAIERLKLATVIQYTLPGVPSVYYGDDAGQEGFEDPFNRRCYDWENPDKAVRRWYKQLGKIRTENADILSEGEYVPLNLGDGVFAFERVSKSGKLSVVVNNSDKPVSFGEPGLVNLLFPKKPFNGKIAPGTAVILKKTEQ